MIKMKRRLIVIIFLLLFVPEIMCCASIRDRYCASEVDLSSPKKTVETYFKHHTGETDYNRAIVSSCFYPPGRYTGKLERFWLQYRIVEERKTDKAGERIPTGITISPDAVEIVVEVRMNHPEKENPKTRFWYLLQEFDGSWKIVQHSHIADEVYPPYD